MDDYKFLKIEDAIACINQKVNLIGAILDFSVPQKTKGTDYFCKLKIIDESHPKCGIPVHLFAQHMDALPQVASIGDIIHLSRVMMKTHEGDVYAIFNKRFSSFALYEGKNGEGFHPYQVSLRFHAREQDEKLIADLRKWLADSKRQKAAALRLFGLLTVRKKFRCVVRFVAAIPWQVEDFCSPRGTYRVRFTVEDPTARIHAFAYAEDGF
ncbi:hypothetical protein SCA6_003805 [Theobroma cacao]